MTHLTMTQILQFIDGTADYAAQAQCTNHLAVCERCRREVEIQKRLSKVARQNVHRTSARFTEQVMSRVAPQLRLSWTAKLLNNLANVFAMMIVLGVLGYAISSTSSFKSEASPELSSLTKSFTDSYAKLKESIQQETNKWTDKVAPPSSGRSQRFVIFAFLTLLALGIVDRFVLRQLMKTKL